MSVLHPHMSTCFQEPSGADILSGVYVLQLASHNSAHMAHMGYLPGPCRHLSCSSWVCNSFQYFL